MIIKILNNALPKLDYTFACNSRLVYFKLENELEYLKGAVHKVRHAIFGKFLPPFPLSHFVTHPGTPRKYVTHLGLPPDF